MSSPLAVTPLVPRANKSKKKRPGFRPVGISSKGGGNNNSSKSPAKSTLADEINNELIAVDGKDGEKVDQGTSGLKEKSGEPSKAAQRPTTPTTKPLKTTTNRKRKHSTSISVGIRNSVHTSTKSADDSSDATKKGRMGAVALSAPAGSSLPPPKMNTEKLNTTIASSSRPTVRTTRSNNTKSSTALVVAKASKLALQASSTTQEKELLERLAAEAPDVARMTSFCSTFKGEKRPRQRKANNDATTARNGQGGNRNNKQNQDPNTASGATSIPNQSNALKRNAPDASGAPVVQIVDGEIVLQESSLVMPGQRRTVQEVEEEFQDVVEEDAQLAIVGASYSSFTDRRKSQRWTVSDTKLFFEALRQVGTDFCSMEVFFENRSRKQLKSKYQAELIRNPALVELALLPKNKTKLDLTIFNVEVDPEAVAAAEKDEPPPYIPTDVEEQGTKAENENVDEPTDKKNSVRFESQATGDRAGESYEVVDEDLEEEQKHQDPQSTNAANPTVKTIIESSHLWQDDGVQDTMDDDGMHFPEPSMDDFFHEQEEIVDPGLFEEVTGLHTTEEATPEPPAQEPSKSAPKVSTAPAISLVPKAGRTKKPTFRSLSRKKK